MSKRGREQFKKYKFLLRVISSFVRILPSKSRVKCFYRLRYAKGKIGMALRYCVLSTIAKKIGDNVSIHEGAFLLNPQNFDFGDNVSIHPMCYLDAQGGISIGSDVSIAHGATLLSFDHLYRDHDVFIKDQGVVPKPLFIKDNVWIGSKVTVLGGVTVESGCVLAAGAVITKNTEKDSIMAGVPARKIGDR